MEAHARTMSDIPTRTVSWFAPLSEQDPLGAKLGDQVRTQWLQNLLPGKADGPNARMAGQVAQHLEQMERELLGEEPTPLDRMLVSHVVNCYLRVQALEIRNAWQQGAGESTRLLEYYDRALDRAHGRLSRAVRDLAFVRRSPVQINLARNLFAVQGQANVKAGGSE
jgi:hypothetical protein